MKDKVRKLLALAMDPNAAPNEAETASRHAAALMARHNIDLADLEGEELRAQWDMTVGEARSCRPGKANAKEVPPWISIIAWGVKTYTRTRVTRSGPYLTFKGPREDVELAVWLHNLILEGCYAASKGQDNPNAFRNGYAGAIQSRLKRMARERDSVDAETGSTALVVVETTRQAEMDREFGPERRGKPSHVAQSEAGYTTGLTVHIPTARPIGGKLRIGQ